MVDSVIAGNTAGNPYSVAPNCTGPLFTNGANSYQWPGPTADVNDAGCGAVNVINPTVSSTKTLCQTSAGVASDAALHFFYASGGAVPKTSGMPNAGAICPSYTPVVGAVQVLNVDGSTAAGSVYDPGTDGVMLLRYLMGFRGSAITGGLSTATATRTDAEIEAHLQSVLAQVDVDADTKTLATTDGLMILRRLQNRTGTALTNSAKNSAKTSADIQATIDSLRP